MQRSVTPLDVFNEATRFSQGVMGYYTEKNREENNLQLKVDGDKSKNGFADVVRDNPYTGGDFNEYRFKLKEEFDKVFNSIIGESGNNSPYYRQMMEQSRRQWHVEADNTARVKADQWRTDKEHISCNEDQERIIESVRRGERTPQQGIEACRDRANLSGTIRPLSFQERYVMDEASKILTHQTLLSERLKNERDPTRLRGILAGVNAEFDWLDEETDEIDGATGEKKIRKWTYKDKEKFEQELLQGRCAELWDERESYGQRLLAAGRPLEEVNEYNRRMRQEFDRYYNPNNSDVWSDLSTKQLTQRDGYFRDLSGYMKQSGTSSQISKRILLDLYGPEMFIRPQVAGDGTVIVGYYDDGRPITEKYESIREAMGGFIHYKRKAFFEAHKNLERPVVQLMWEQEQSDFFGIFYGEVEKAMKQIDPQLAIDFANFRKTDIYIKSEGDYFNRDVNRMSALERDQYGQRCVQFFESIFFNGITDVPTIRQMMRDFTGGEILNVFGRRPNSRNEETRFNEMKAYSDRVMSGGAEHTVFVINEPERLRLGLNTSDRPQNQVSYGWRDHRLQEAAEAFRNEERGILAGILGVRTDALKPRWMASDGQQGDVIPKGIFVIGEGANARTVRLNYENNEYKVEELKNKEWVRGESRERDRTHVENRRNDMQIMDSGRHPITREEGFSYTMMPPNYNGTSNQWNVALDGAKRAAWVEYSEGMRNGTVITQMVNAGKNPLNGEPLNTASMPPHLRSTMTARTWAGKPPEFVKQEWIKHFEQQVRR